MSQPSRNEMVAEVKKALPGANFSFTRITSNGITAVFHKAPRGLKYVVWRDGGYHFAGGAAATLQDAVTAGRASLVERGLSTLVSKLDEMVSVPCP